MGLHGAAPVDRGSTPATTGDFVTELITDHSTANAGMDRRTVIKAAAWTVPAIAIAVAAPRAAASTSDVGAYSLSGSCGAPGIQGPGFVLVASATAPVPTGTTVLISGTGVSSIGVFSSTPSGMTTQTRLSGTATQFTLTADLPAGTAISFRTTLSTSARWTLNALTTLPEGYTATGAKSDAVVTSSLTGCSTS